MQIAENVFTAHEVADRLGISESRVYQLARARGLGTKKGLLLFNSEDIEGMRTRINGRPRKHNTRRAK